MYRYSVIIFIIIFSAATLCAEIISTEQMELISRMLASASLDTTDLNFLKDWSTDTEFKLPVVVDVINNPLRYPELVQQMEDTIKEREVISLLQKADALLHENNREIPANDFEDYFNRKVKSYQDIFDYVEYVWDDVSVSFERTWESLSASELEKVRYFAYSYLSESQDSLAYREFFQKRDIAEFEELTMDDMLPILKKVNFAYITKAALKFQHGFDILLENILAERFDFPDKLVKKETKWGTFVIGTEAGDIYEKNYSFILDPGGDDLYLSDIYTDFSEPFYWTIDLGGDDIYQNSSIASLFSVFGGLGINYSHDGNDTYRGGDYALSSLFGYQFSQQRKGDNIYRCGLHSLGAASFGVSFLIDETGNDSYHVTQFGQGFAGPMAVGILIDHEGNDQYYAGGKYTHEPLMPLDYRSMAQGFGFGLRPYLGGGIALLYDGAGNDHYNGGVYAQASAYWYALGMLIDGGGNDVFTAVYYPQGSGIHLAGGFLLNREGDDMYYSRHGPGQGAGHDYGVGFFIDQAGNDSYSIEGGNGLALTNSVAIFIDTAGNDRYERYSETNYGYGRTARGSGSIGLFLDTGGDNYYALQDCENDSTWQRGYFGFGLDTLMVEIEDPVEQLSEESLATVDSTDTIENLFALASQWEVGSAKKQVEKARAFLLEREDETAGYIAANEMDTRSGLTFRAIEHFAKNSNALQGYFPMLLVSSDSLVVKNTISLIGNLGAEEYLSYLEGFIHRGEYLPTTLSALGGFKNERSVQFLEQFITSSSERLRVITARSLKAIDSEESRKLLSSMSDDSSFLVRSLVDLSFKDD